jgi:hypothetical protein
MIDWEKKLELQGVLNRVRVWEKTGQNRAAFLRGYTGDFLLYVQFGMLVENVYIKNAYTKIVFEISRQ